MKRLKSPLATLLLAAALVMPAAAQELGYTTSQPLMLPHDTFFGMAAGVATNSKGNVFVYTRNGEPTVSLGGSRAFAHGGSSLYEFAPDGKFIRQIGKQVYGFLAAQQVRVDSHDNIWVVDRYSSMVMKFDPQGRVVMLLGRKPESVDVPSSPDTGRGNPPGSGQQSDLFQSPTDVAWDADGNIFVADGIGNARVAKFTRDGVFVKSWGSRGTGDGQFKTAHAIAVDAAGNVYVGDRGNNRIQVFDNNGTFKSSITSGGDPEALCITPGAHQYLYSSNSNPANDLDHGGDIIKLELSGTVVGKFGQAGKGPRDFGSVNAIDCRNANSLYVAEAGNWRVTKVDLH
ncbi:MAG TPA: peptidyl-alpha-hydroxyglycine alpha-amidating lyase family protein [Rhizomicrobium sp.]|nr:peptidyl-alpha-hydroxyglycine alpha-amidating lyase family protein [Rhizomicrobium sp.]